MKKLLTLAAGLAALCMFVADASASSAGRSCRDGDRLVKRPNGTHTCYDAKRDLPKGYIVINVQPDRQAPPRRTVQRPVTAAVGPAPAPMTVAPAPSGPASTLEQFAEKTEACFAQAGALAAADGQPGCYVGKDGRIHCTGPNYEQLVTQCRAVGNTAGMPARWNR